MWSCKMGPWGQLRTLEGTAGSVIRGAPGHRPAPRGHSREPAVPRALHLCPAHLRAFSARWWGGPLGTALPVPMAGGLAPWGLAGSSGLFSPPPGPDRAMAGGSPTWGTGPSARPVQLPAGGRGVPVGLGRPSGRPASLTAEVRPGRPHPPSHHCARTVHQGRGVTAHSAGAGL